MLNKRRRFALLERFDEPVERYKINKYVCCIEIYNISLLLSIIPHANSLA